MKERTVWLRVTIALLVVASCIFAAVQADTPEKLVAELQRSARDRDVESFLSYLTLESRKIVETSDAESVALRDLHAEFEKALDERFGKGTAWIPDTDTENALTDAITGITNIELVSKTEAADGSVELKVRTTVRGEKTETIEQTVGARQEDGEWKLSLGFPVFDAQRIKTNIERITREVRDGKYEDRVAAMIALDNAIREQELAR